MSRWSAAASLLALPRSARVLDLGCAFGFGTRLLQDRYQAFGHDLSAPYIGRAMRVAPRATFTCGPADSVPYPNDYFDGILVLDVLEHVPDVDAVAVEIRRVLKPGGKVIVSVPNRGTFAFLDSLNVYESWFGPSAPVPTDDPSWPLRRHHRHFHLAELTAIFGDDFRLQSVRYTGLGLAETVNLILLVLFRRILHWPLAYSVLQYLYFGVYLAEDNVSTGPWGYHMMVEMQRA